ncbi:MAG: FAD-binding oxidoreductase [Alphaproteobacteria bacterium]
MMAKRLPKDPGPAAWNEILPAAEPYPSLGAKTTADWLVVGAGFAGLSAARRLNQIRPGDQIAVLEASRVAHGPAGRNSGVMVDLPHDLASDDYGGTTEVDRIQIQQNRAAIDFAWDAAREYHMPEEAIRRSGKINAAATKKGTRHNRDYAEHLRRLGEPSEFLDARQMQEITGSTFFESGLFTPGTAILQPALYIRSLAAGLVSNRVRIYERSPALSLNRENGTWVARTPDGAVYAPKVILAVNGHAESFGLYAGRLMHVFTYASMTRALTAAEVKRLGGRPNWAATPSDPMGTTVRRISGVGGDRIVIRNRFTFDPLMEVSDARIRDVGRNHDRSFAARFPMLNGVAMEYRWGGRLCLSWNNVPAFGEVEDGLYAACCQNGLGTTKGTFGGMMAAELAAGQKSDALDTILNQDGPRKLPPAPLSTIGATAQIRYREWMAGREL